MAIHFDIARSPQDFEQILELQRQNHLDALSGDDLASTGFVYARHTPELLQAFAAHLPQVIARSEDRVVGYTLAMPVALREALPELVPMFAQFDRTQFRGRPLSDYRYMVGGQVCVARDFRGRGLLGRLYDECDRRLPADFTLCVTEISERNVVSLRAHLKVGFERIGAYRDDHEQWDIVARELTHARADER
jgi:GNAT superfamily N-acetyltransferase